MPLFDLGTLQSGTDLKSAGNEVAIETIKLAHKGLKVSTP